MSDIEKLKQAIRRLHGVESTHVETVGVTESFQGKIICDGKVEVFYLIGHPQAKRVFAWTHKTDDPNKPERQVTVLEIPPVISPQTAVRALIVNDFKNE